MNQHEKINYLEFPVKDIEQVKTFFIRAFGWNFTDYGDEYTAFSSEDAGVDGGFYKSDRNALTENGSVLVVFYSINLERTQVNIEKAGGEVIKPVFSFPGGRRFHFIDPNGNEFAVWSE